MPHAASRIISPAALRAKHVGYVLPNGVRCVIIQDPNAKMPAAAMSIAAGQLNDPPALPGLAHFCEHMLFMGTEKFPKEDEYDSYISKNNGANNAFTSNRATVFYFQISDTALDGALERFAEFFVAPTFNESAVNREVQAVHSEDEKNHSVDYWRMDEVLRGMYNEKHPRSRYGNGNVTTLVDEPKAKGLQLREELKSFYAANYAAEAACISVYSARDPESVMRLIEPPLLRMRPGKGPTFHFIPDGEGLFKPGVLGSWMNLKTVRKSRSIRVQWPVKSSSALWRCMPSAYISHVLGHECDSSVLGVLKKRDWATAMVAGGSACDDDYQLFYVSIDLTVEGFRHIPEVVGLVYQYVGCAVNNGVDRDVYTQMKAEERLSFESQEVDSPSSHCISVAQNAAQTDLEHCIIGGQCVLEDDFEAALSYAKQLTPDNAHVSVLWGSLPSAVAAADEAKSGAGTEGEETDAMEKEEDEDDENTPVDESGKDGEGGASPEALFASLPAFAQRPADTLSRFHKTQYCQVPIPEEQLAAWRAALANPTCADLKLPSTNPFIATDFTVFPSTATAGQAVAEVFESGHGVTVIRKDASHHNTFKSAVYWDAISPAAYASPLHRFYAQVMSSILQDSMTELSYYGELASLENELARHAGGLGVVISGPCQQLPTFFARLLDHALHAATLKGTREKYDTYGDQYVRSMESRASMQPYEHVIERLTKVAAVVNYTFEDILAAAPSATYEGYTAFVDDFLRSGVIFECFVAGNMRSAQDAMDSMVSVVEKKLSERDIPVAAKSTITRFRDSLDLSSHPASAPSSSAPSAGAAAVLTTLDAVSFPPFNPEDPNVSALLAIFTGKTDARTAAVSSVAAKMISSLFFNALRTKESLGYVVFSQYRPLLNGSHLVFGAQSAVEGVDGVYLLSRTVAFLSALEGAIDRLCTEAELLKITNGLIQALEKLPDSVAQDALQLQQDYQSCIGLNNRKERIEALKALSVAEVRAFFSEYVYNGRTKARGLALVVNSARTAATDALALTKPGTTSVTKLVSLPPKRTLSSSGDSTAEGAAASPSGDEELTLPTFDEPSAGPVMMEVTLFDGLDSYKSGRPVLRSGTF